MTSVIQENSQSGKLQLGVVPISGIAVGRIHRFENELRTVLERWGHLDQKPEKKVRHCRTTHRLYMETDAHAQDERKDDKHNKPGSLAERDNKKDPRKTSVSVFVDKKKERPGSVATETNSANSHLLTKLEDRARRMSSASDEKLNLLSKSPSIPKPLARNDSFKESSSPVPLTPQSSSPLSQSYESGSSQLSPERGKALARHVSATDMSEKEMPNESSSRNRLMQMRSAASEDLGASCLSTFLL